jgi:hypothetical protein
MDDKRALVPWEINLSIDLNFPTRPPGVKSRGLIYDRELFLYQYFFGVLATIKYSFNNSNLGIRIFKRFICSMGTLQHPI